ncbi:MAG: bifunctional 5,10-methylene-tetrahydrofolate dehydrogenase/5,10-methylene-tetrahydrofolate cyclohydrolase, partial [Flavobacteriales bacterium]|nr:bifunctional 5,10-methylene-tetrahydrofolate dehydrogenase/5,10-methylene-tetrahydrofolate cyclohydrolase [Flavobacteriales bacterium]
MILLDGNATSKQIREEIAAEVAERNRTGKRIPHLAAILVGN